MTRATGAASSRRSALRAWETLAFKFDGHEQLQEFPTACRLDAVASLDAC